jgi:hypothetical protein
MVTLCFLLTLVSVEPQGVCLLPLSMGLFGCLHGCLALTDLTGHMQLLVFGCVQWISLIYERCCLFAGINICCMN